MMAGAVCFPIGVLWFAWTSFPSISPWPQIISGLPIGAGIVMIYMQGIAYIVDVYTINASSATSASSVVRSITAAGFVMFAAPMYNRLGVSFTNSSFFFFFFFFFFSLFNKNKESRI
jgi:MFS transporter, DHA1 family, multidrug resistance protein